MRGLPVGRTRATLFWSTLGVTLLPLAAFKYLVTLSPGPWSGFALPVGLSFYTFQGVGYVIDSYLNDNAIEGDWLRFATFMSFFATVTAGPIERGRHFLPQLDRLGSVDYQRVVAGMRAILAGLVMKVVMADTLLPIVEEVYRQPSCSQAGDLALATVYFSFQVYADFAGYSLMAIGASRILGIELFPNFAQPYLSRSLPEFWRTWHMTLRRGLRLRPDSAELRVETLWRTRTVRVNCDDVRHRGNMARRGLEGLSVRPHTWPARCGVNADPTVS